jgi:hypothetical protein
MDVFKKALIVAAASDKKNFYGAAMQNYRSLNN